MSRDLVVKSSVTFKDFRDNMAKVFSLVKSGNDGRQYFVVIDFDGQSVLEVVNAGKKSMTVIFDYKTRYLAFRSFKDQACYAVKMPADFATLNDLKKMMENPKTEAELNKKPPVQYTSNNNPVKNKVILGAPIEALCHDLPINWAAEQRGEMLFSTSACLGFDFVISVDFCWSM
ncbi:gastrokine-1-like isoform X1 [Arapaima gigas]